MSEGKNVPKIRFPEFNGEWEEYELGQLMSRYEDHVETPHNGYERLGIRSHAKGVFHSHVNAGEELETAKMQRVAADKFIVNITFAWEHAVAITDENDAGLLVSHRFPQFSFDEKLQSGFFEFQMLDKRFKKHLELSSPGGAGRNRVLKIDDMMKYTVRIPSVAEQKKIASFLQMVDQIICEIQNDLDKWKELKKGMLQKMFPREGESVPEIRFPGFDGNWISKKISELGSCKNGMNFHTAESGIEVICLGVGDFKDRTEISDVSALSIVSLNEFPADDYFLRDGDIVFVRSNGNKDLVGRSLVIYPGGKRVVFSGFCIRFRPENTDIINEYLIQVLKTDSIKKALQGRGSDIKNLNQEILGNIEIYFPCIEEQRLISGFFSTFDDAIVKAKNELDKWKELKKGLLQQMFV